jgi:hypothetical protein
MAEVWIATLNTARSDDFTLLPASEILQLHTRGTSANLNPSED